MRTGWLRSYSQKCSRSKKRLSFGTRQIPVRALLWKEIFELDSYVAKNLQEFTACHYNHNPVRYNPEEWPNSLPRPLQRWANEMARNDGLWAIDIELQVSQVYFRLIFNTSIAFDQGQLEYWLAINDSQMKIFYKIRLWLDLYTSTRTILR